MSTENTAPKRLLTFTSGGDAPGMNAALRAVVRTAIHSGVEIFGCEMGFAGLINEEIFPLDQRFVANCIQRGGTILKTGRCPEFLERKTRDKVRAFLAKQKFDGMIILGGDGSFRGATILREEGGPPTIGVPCTIDNDIAGSEYTIGFDTARNTALDAIDKIRDTAFSHERNFIIEVMGRASGFLAVDVGIAGGAEIIIIPEFPLSIEDVAQKIQQRRRNKMASIIVMAEGGKTGSSVTLSEELKKRTGFQYRVCILGHTQRGGSPTAMDREIATTMGYQAVLAILSGQQQKMVVYQGGKTALADFPTPEKATRFFTDEALFKMNQILS